MWSEVVLGMKNNEGDWNEQYFAQESEHLHNTRARMEDQLNYEATLGHVN